MWSPSEARSQIERIKLNYRNNDKENDMSGKDEARLKEEALRRIQHSLELHNMAVATQHHAVPLGPMVADAFQTGVIRAATEVDLEIRTYAYDHLGMVPRGHKEESSDN